MLANGATLAYATTSGASSYTTLPGLKQIPDIGNNPEKVDNTCLTDTVKKYELGIGDPGDLAFVFKYDNSSVDSPYRVLRPYEASKQTLYFKETLFDGTTITFAAQIALTLNGGGVNGVIEFTLTLGLQSDFKITDPSA